jgi:hypothetical protein
MRLPSSVNASLAALGLFASLTACQSEQPNQPAPKDQLIGLWKLDNYREVTTRNGRVNNDQTQPVNGTMEFRRNGKVISVDETGNAEEGTWNLVDGGRRIRIIFSDIASAGFAPAGFLSGSTFELEAVKAGSLALRNRSSLSARGESVKYELTFNLEK